ncbi:Acetyltransferase (GNAT) family protein [Rheinheimera pacifica]|uniref:Acetyltransferase (GNAT) family protein n=1 Tax=Rheinheimera pacifica TaxID=173990 RepID=A0A1H6MMX8_9GAMM|nr:GNAT family N-acetyltransferase [Rheinheimera pacifica]SEH99019.1 Acetyltransferase (GNAT) family protein [Rheinheimera pacifica]
MRNDLTSFFHVMQNSGYLVERIRDLDGYVNKLLGNATIFSIYEKGELAAVSACYINDPDKILAYVSYIGVLPKFQRRGFASNLLDSSINYAQRCRLKIIRLEVSSDNTAAKKLYENKGFVCEKFIDNSIFMELSLNDFRSSNM